MLFFGEWMTVLQIVGAVITLTAIYFGSLRVYSRKNRPAQAAK
jgi:hypothetical protein